MTSRSLGRLGFQFTGFSFPGVPAGQLYAQVAEMAQTAEKSGFDSIWLMDHLQQIPTVGDPREPILEAYTTLAGLTRDTSAAVLGVLVSAVGFRNPALLAKMVANIDVMSGGRAALGLGAGWHGEEYRAYGLPFPPLKERMRQLAETAEICRALFTGAPVSFEGEHFRVEEATLAPRPLTSAGPPILIGGSGEKTLIPMVARLGDGCNFFGGPATVRHKISLLDRACESLGRDPATVTRTWLGTALVTDSDRELEAGLERLAGLFGVSPAAVRGLGLFGSPDQVAEQAAAYLATGLDTLIVNIDDAHDLARLETAGAALSAGFGPGFGQAGSSRTPTGPTGIADTVAGVWEETLGTPALDRHAGFFDLGADSQSVVLAVERLREHWPGLRAIDVFTYPSVAELSAFLARKEPR